MSQSKYFRYQAPRRQNTGVSDVERGLSAGESISKMLDPLGKAIAGMRKDALANRLMDEASISEQPGAGQTQDLGKLPDDGSGSSSSGPSSDASASAPAPDPDPDPVATAPSTAGAGINAGSLDAPGVQQYDYQDMPDLSRAVAAKQLSASPASQGPQPGPSQPAGDFTLNPSDYSSAMSGTGGKIAGNTGAGTVGGLVHTGGVDEMDLRKEMLAQQVAKLGMAREQLSMADEQAKQAGTGQYALDRAAKRAALEHTLAETKALTNKPESETEPPVSNITTEPVTDWSSGKQKKTAQERLNNYYDGQYGNGMTTKILSSLADPTRTPDIVNDVNNKPAGVTVMIGMDDLTGKAKTMTIPIQDAQTLIKQQNVLRNQQGQPLLRVPGEDLSVGVTRQNPYKAKTNLDVYSRAPAGPDGTGGWVTLPNGKITHLIRKPDGTITGVDT